MVATLSTTKYVNEMTYAELKAAAKGEVEKLSDGIRLYTLLYWQCESALSTDPEFNERHMCKVLRNFLKSNGWR